MNCRIICSVFAFSLAVMGCGRTTALAPDLEVETTGNPEATAGEPFKFTSDSSGQLLAKTLTPPAPGRLLDAHTPRVKPYPAPQSLQVPYLPVSAGQAFLPAVPRTTVVRDLKPRLVSDETVFNPSEELSLPQAISFPVPERIRLASVDVNKPIPLPVLARPLADPAPLEDPTGAASTAAVLAAPLPPRTRPAPFVKLTVPEPYENRTAAVRLKPAPPETTVPTATATLRTPGK